MYQSRSIERVYTTIVLFPRYCASIKFPKETFTAGMYSLRPKILPPFAFLGEKNQALCQNVMRISCLAMNTIH